MQKPVSLIMKIVQHSFYPGLDKPRENIKFLSHFKLFLKEREEREKKGAQRKEVKEIIKETKSQQDQKKNIIKPYEEKYKESIFILCDIFGTSNYAKPV